MLRGARTAGLVKLRRGIGTIDGRQLWAGCGHWPMPCECTLRPA